MVGKPSPHPIDDVIDPSDRHAAVGGEPTIEAELRDAAPERGGIMAQALGELLYGDAGGWS